MDMINYTADALFIRPLASLGQGDLDQFGGKNAMLGEMIRHMETAGLWAPKGFAISVAGFDQFVGRSGIADWIEELLAAIKPDRSNVTKIAATIRSSILSSDMPPELEREIIANYRVLVEDVGDWPLPVAVLTSVTPDHMIAEAFGGRPPACLFVQNAEALLNAVRKCYAALYSERAIGYRLDKGIPHDAARLSIAVQTTVWANTTGLAAEADDPETSDSALRDTDADMAASSPAILHLG
jgi:pyruvate,water dikinase